LSLLEVFLCASRKYRKGILNKLFLDRVLKADGDEKDEKCGNGRQKQPTPLVGKTGESTIHL
jgi:hypothetical protein